jgi:hypothetical protein
MREGQQRFQDQDGGQGRMLDSRNRRDDMDRGMMYGLMRDRTRDEICKS